MTSYTDIRIEGQLEFQFPDQMFFGSVMNEFTNFRYMHLVLHYTSNCSCLDGL